MKKQHRNIAYQKTLASEWQDLNSKSWGLTLITLRNVTLRQSLNFYESTSLSKSEVTEITLKH